MLKKLLPLFLLTLLFFAACKSSKQATEVSATTRTVLADTTHVVRVTAVTADSSAVVAVLTIDSLTLAPVAVEVFPDSLAAKGRAAALRGGGLQAADKLLSGTSQVALRPVRVYGLRLAVKQTAVAHAATDSLQHAAQTAVSEETVTHATETAKASRPSVGFTLGIYVGAFLLLAALAYFLYLKHGKTA